MTLIAALAFSAILGLSIVAMWQTLSEKADVILAALEGRSPASRQVMVARPVTVRVSARRVSQPVAASPLPLRAAA